MIAKSLDRQSFLCSCGRYRTWLFYRFPLGVLHVFVVFVAFEPLSLSEEADDERQPLSLPWMPVT